VLDLWGGGGGLVEYRAALLASHGFTTMALKYLDEGDTDLTTMNMGYFEVGAEPGTGGGAVGAGGAGLGHMQVRTM